MYPETPGGNRIVEIGGGPFETGRALGRLHARTVAERLVGEPAWREVIQRGRADEREVVQSSDTSSLHSPSWIPIRCVSMLPSRWPGQTKSAPTSGRAAQYSRARSGPIT